MSFFNREKACGSVGLGGDRISAGNAELCARIPAHVESMVRLCLAAPPYSDSVSAMKGVSKENPGFPISAVSQPISAAVPRPDGSPLSLYLMVNSWKVLIKRLQKMGVQASIQASRSLQHSYRDKLLSKLLLAGVEVFSRCLPGIPFLGAYLKGGLKFMLTLGY